MQEAPNGKLKRTLQPETRHCPEQANHSFISGKGVAIADLVPGIPLPDYPVMPSHTEPVPMPPRT